MLVTLHISARAAILTALLGGAALLAPTAAQAQAVAPERALLNRIDPGPLGAGAGFARVPETPARAPRPIDGQQALLNRPAPVDPRSGTEPRRSLAGFAQTPYADGVRALLNRSAM